MSIFDKTKNEKYVYFLSNFSEIFLQWVDMNKQEDIKVFFDVSSTQLFGMSVEKAQDFFAINITTLTNLEVVKESFKYEIGNKNLKKQNNVYNDVKIHHTIDRAFMIDSRLLKFCEYSLNIVSTTLINTKWEKISSEGAIKNKFNQYIQKIFLLLEWFNIYISKVVNKNNRVYVLGLHEDTESKLFNKVSTFEDIGIIKKHSKTEREKIFKEYFMNNGNLVTKTNILNKFVPFIEEKREEIKEFNPKLEYDIFSFLLHTKYRNALTLQEDQEYEKQMDKVFKKAVLTLYLLDLE